MRTINASNFRKDMFNYLNQAIDNNHHIAITTKNGNAVLISEQEYNSLMETSYLNSIPGLADSLISAMNEPENEHVTVDWKNELQDRA